jgi:hypothetical protein
MPRSPAPCGTYSAYKRHLRKGEPVDAACRAASVERSREQTRKRHGDEPSVTFPTFVAEEPAWDDFDEERRNGDIEPTSVPSGDRVANLRWSLGLIVSAMDRVVIDDPSKLAPLSKRHSELLAEIAALDGSGAVEDPFDAFLSSGNVIGITTASSRKQA